MELRIENVGHHYGGGPVLDRISLDVAAGEVLCLVGPSGCGKSTLLRLVGGLEKPAEGRVLTGGDVPEGCLNPISFVFQHFNLLPWRTVSGNVSLVLEGRLGRAARREAIADVLARTGLSDFASALPRQLSGGMRQRVAISRALATRPAVMLLDEPLSALDAQTRELLMEDLVGLWLREPFTAVYVTHNLAEAVRLGHRVAVLSRRPGRVREVVTISTPLGERSAATPEVAEAQAHLWHLIRDEAAAADRTLADA